jgi:hypothetical protein
MFDESDGVDAHVVGVDGIPVHVVPELESRSPVEANFVVGIEFFHRNLFGEIGGERAYDQHFFAEEKFDPDVGQAIFVMNEAGVYFLFFQELVDDGGLATFDGQSDNGIIVQQSPIKFRKHKSIGAVDAADAEMKVGYVRIFDALQDGKHSFRYDKERFAGRGENDELFAFLAFYQRIPQFFFQFFQSLTGRRLSERQKFCGFAETSRSDDGQKSFDSRI